MNQHSPHADLPTLSSTSPINTTRTQLHPTPSQNNTPTHRRRRILHPTATHLPPEPTATEIRNDAARTAKLSIREKLREDWEWDPAASLLHRLHDDNTNIDPNLNGYNDNNDNNNTTNNDENDNEHNDDTVSDDSTHAPTWREREIDSSDASATEPPHHTPQSQPYKYDTPDSLTTNLLTRKRARRHALDDEMRWNDGLRTYVLRRDDWTGGRVKIVHHTLPPAPITLRHPPPPSSSAPATVAIRTEVVPLAPPLLPATHPIRANINAATYPSIYSKVVVQGLAPTVPINLRDMTSALVVGWKEEDLWPPKGTVSEAGIAVRRKGTGDGGGGRNGMGEGVERERGLAKGVGAFKRALGLGVGVGGNVERGGGLGS